MKNRKKTKRTKRAFAAAPNSISAVGGKMKGRKIPYRKLFAVMGLTVVFFTVYQLALKKPAFAWVFHAYWSGAGVLAAAYIVWNRGILRIPEKEQLTDEWSGEEKESFLAACRERKKKSAWILYLLLPLLLTVLFDMIIIFMTDTLGIAL